MNKIKNISHCPRLLYSKVDYSQKIIVQSLLGPNIENLLKFCGRIFPIKTVINIGIETLSRIKGLHEIGIIHRDIKPSNMVYGDLSYEENNGKKSIILIDYGLAILYIGKNKKHINYKSNAGHVGTIRFSSRHSLNGEQKSRRDDIESWFYSLVYLFKGKLPWDNIDPKRNIIEQMEIVCDKICNLEDDFLQGMPY